MPYASAEGMHSLAFWELSSPCTSQPERSMSAAQQLYVHRCMSTNGCCDLNETYRPHQVCSICGGGHGGHCIVVRIVDGPQQLTRLHGPMAHIAPGWAQCCTLGQR
jgi:hypothetical protein